MINKLLLCFSCYFKIHTDLLLFSYIVFLYYLYNFIWKTRVGPRYARNVYICVMEICILCCCYWGLKYRVVYEYYSSVFFSFFLINILKTIKHSYTFYTPCNILLKCKNYMEAVWFLRTCFDTMEKKLLQKISP